MRRGSRKHVLDWTSQSRFVPELLAMLLPVRCCVTAASMWMPMGHSSPREARLERFGAQALPGHPAWPALIAWWLRHPAGANTPNWDIALSCDVEGQPGLVLVEAKANVPELGTSGKPLAASASRHSADNHERIDDAIREARDGLAASLPSVSIDRNRHYQLSNRVAYGWKLASLGIPTVLLYLGFTGDEGIRDAGEPFKDDDHWQQVFREHLRGVCPLEILNGPVQVGPARLWVLSRSRPALELSGPNGPR
jgi:hypothetical protein